MVELTFGERLCDLRKKHRLTQRQLGEILGVGDTAISDYEADRFFPPQDRLAKIAAYFHVSYDELLGGPIPGREGVFAQYKRRAYTIDDVMKLLLLMNEEEREIALSAIVAIRDGAKMNFADVIGALLAGK